MATPMIKYGISPWGDHIISKAPHNATKHSSFPADSFWFCMQVFSFWKQKTDLDFCSNCAGLRHKPNLNYMGVTVFCNKQADGGCDTEKTWLLKVVYSLQHNPNGKRLVNPADTQRLLPDNFLFWTDKSNLLMNSEVYCPVQRRTELPLPLAAKHIKSSF